MIDNISCNRFALGDREGEVSLTSDDFTQAVRIDDKAGNVPMKTIDSFEFKSCILVRPSKQQSAKPKMSSQRLAEYFSRSPPSS